MPLPAVPVIIALRIAGAVASRVAPKAFQAYKKFKRLATTEKTNAAKKKAVNEANKAAKRVQNAADKSKIKGFGQKAKLDVEKVKQARLRTKKMKNFGNINKNKNVAEKVVDKGKDVVVDATKKTGSMLMKPFSAARTVGSRVTGFGRRAGEPFRPIRKGLSASAYGISDASDATVRAVGGDKMGDAFTKRKKEFLGMRGGGKIQYKVDNQGQDFVKKMYGGKVKK
tara:strand:- start:425 stop:1102 length:678 start_codon:yes stop_codon:yes gene_type:complete